MDEDLTYKCSESEKTSICHYANYVKTYDDSNSVYLLKDFIYTLHFENFVFTQGLSHTLIVREFVTYFL